ncbi:hypothetical protein ACA910_017815 [Epithemia clementina (nom. ined.)]
MIPEVLSNAILITVYFAASEYKGGEYTLWCDDKLVSTISILSAQGRGCARCSSIAEASIAFEASEASDVFQFLDEAKATDISKFRLTRNEDTIEIKRMSFKEWGKE